jgi:hypothetical protein
MLFYIVEAWHPLYFCCDEITVMAKQVCYNFIQIILNGINVVTGQIEAGNVIAGHTIVTVATALENQVDRNFGHYSGDSLSLRHIAYISFLILLLRILSRFDSKKNRDLVG